MAKIKVYNNMLNESGNLENKSILEVELTNKLISIAKKVNKKYVGKKNLIANEEKITDYLVRFAEALILVDGSAKTNKNKYIKTKDDVKFFLKESLPDLVLENKFPKNIKPFTFLDKLETITIKNVMNSNYWIEEKDLNMISVNLSDAVDIIKIGVNFSQFEFVKGCESITRLDTAVRDYFLNDLYDWKNLFQKRYSKNINIGHEYEKYMKIKYKYNELKKEINNLDIVEKPMYKKIKI